MSRRLLGSLVLLTLLATSAHAEEVTSVGVGEWSGGRKGSVSSITIQGEDIYLDGVLQEQKFTPGSDIVIRDGKAVVVPKSDAAKVKKSARKAGAKQAREAEKTTPKAGEGDRGGTDAN